MNETFFSSNFYAVLKISSQGQQFGQNLATSHIIYLWFNFTDCIIKHSDLLNTIFRS